MAEVVDIRDARSGRGRQSARGSADRGDRERASMVLRRQGHKYEEIARELGYADRSGARKAVERGRMGWAHETGEHLRAVELERIEMMIGRLMPSVDCDDPDLKAMEMMAKLVDRRARLLGLYAKRPAPPDSYPGMPNRVAEEKGRKVARYIELADKLVGDIVEAGIGSGIYRGPDDDEQLNAIDERPVAAPFVVEDPADDEGVPDGYCWFEGELVAGGWIDGKFAKSLDATPVLRPPDGGPRPPTQLHSGVPLAAEAFRMDDGAAGARSGGRSG